MPKKIILIVGAGILCLSILIGLVYKKQSQGEEVEPEYVFTYAENQPAGYPTTLGAYRFSELVYERTKGRIKIVVYPDGALGDEVSVIEQLQFGGIDFARASVMSLGEFEEKMNVLQLPYLYRSSKHMWNVLEGEIGEEFMDSLKPSGLKALSWYDAGTRNFYTTTPVKRLEDMKGKKIRVAESELMQDMVTDLGGTPVPLAYSEVFSALETGAIDGAENNLPSYVFTDHYKVAKYLILDGHNQIPELQLASMSSWNQLSESDQQLMKECSLESAVYERKLWKEQEEKSRMFAEKNGVEIMELSSEEISRFREKVRPLYLKFSGEYQDVIDEIESVKD